jgi:hypothetical protein
MGNVGGNPAQMTGGARAVARGAAYAGEGVVHAVGGLLGP